MTADSLSAPVKQICLGRPENPFILGGGVLLDSAFVNLNALCVAAKDSTSVGGTLMLPGTTGTDIFSVEVRSQLAIEKASNPRRIKAGKLFFIMLAFERVKVRTESSRLTRYKISDRET
jgi:hypothetical protein